MSLDFGFILLPKEIAMFAIALITKAALSLNSSLAAVEIWALHSSIAIFNLHNYSRIFTCLKMKRSIPS